MFTFSAFFLVSGTSVIDFRYFVSASPEGLLCPIERVLASITFHFSTFHISRLGSPVISSAHPLVSKCLNHIRMTTEIGFVIVYSVF